ncbi:MAG: 5-oxoprolinase subunit PxpA [Dokdonella sp.]
MTEAGPSTTNLSSSNPATARSIDLNCDLGESFGAWTMGADAAVMPWISSANIACGFHAGDPDTMRRTLELAVRAKVAVGAHVSLPDLAGFGRREMRVSPDETYAMTLYQIGALAGFARAAGTRLRHVKPHGALYNMAARDARLAAAFAQAVRDFDIRLILVGLCASELTRAGQRVGLDVAHEAFTDRRYQDDGSLTPRSEADAVIADVDVAVAQALAIASRSEVTTCSGSKLTLAADTLCVHGDRVDAALFARRLHEGLKAAGITVRALATEGAA